MLSRLFALSILILLSPIFLLVSLAILIEDGFPVFFTQKRVGINYTFFNIYKFRSMQLNADTRRHQSYFRNLVRLNKPMVKLDLQYDSRLIRGGWMLVIPRGAAVVTVTRR